MTPPIYLCNRQRPLQKNHNQPICWVQEPTRSGYIYKIPWHLGIRNIADGSQIRSHTFKVWSHQHDHPNMIWKRRTPTNISKWMGESRRPQPYTNNYRQLSKSGSRKDGLHREKHSYWLLGLKQSALKTHMHVNATWTFPLYLEIHMYIQIHIYMQ